MGKDLSKNPLTRTSQGIPLRAPGSIPLGTPATLWEYEYPWASPSFPREGNPLGSPLWITWGVIPLGISSRGVFPGLVCGSPKGSLGIGGLGGSPVNPLGDPLDDLGVSFPGGGSLGGSSWGLPLARGSVG